MFLVGMTGYESLPAAAQQRAHSLALVLQGKPTDSSAADRKQRAIDAIELLRDQPFGNGWAAAGWVHSDFIQVAANLGIVAGLIFAGAYSATLLRLWRRFQVRARFPADGDLTFALLLSFTTAGGILAMEGVEVLPQLVLPVWFVWVLVEVFLRQNSTERRIATVDSSGLHSAANLQLRHHRPAYARFRQVGG